MQSDSINKPKSCPSLSKREESTPNKLATRDVSQKYRFGFVRDHDVVHNLGLVDALLDVGAERVHSVSHTCDNLQAVKDSLGEVPMRRE